jgi:hypothetical protein
MNTALWAVQGLLALLFFATGLLKAAMPKEKLEQKMRWAQSWPAGRIKLLGLSEVLGAIGLIAPGLTHLLVWLTPLAAACLAFLMVGATVTHVRLKESPLPSLIPGVLAAAVAVGRLVAG